jgi:hypothetical protein
VCLSLIAPAGTRPLADLAVLDLATLTWRSSPKAQGPEPSPRGQPTAVALTPEPATAAGAGASAAGRGQEVLFFGGWDGRRRYNDLHSLELEVGGGGAWRRL